MHGMRHGRSPGSIPSSFVCACGALPDTTGLRPSTGRQKEGCQCVATRLGSTVVRLIPALVLKRERSSQCIVGDWAGATTAHHMFRQLGLEDSMQGDTLHSIECHRRSTFGTRPGTP
ncbi:hypothetical protein DL89DRAFT_101369 [Linderina pennispora]|uniref:Uncharacterized protein n=1 Tax=Linderina pennispora TaxID=61395 RepID=A0A1Y1WE31_9FUNG|nr:uncharacterized protein DL89DRAFT_101369 [Linderina pennispora]ORX71780.1 hypothetical protein DL89DRAFT_101369 [Linderina pennispora]